MRVTESIADTNFYCEWDQNGCKSATKLRYGRDAIAKPAAVSLWYVNRESDGAISVKHCKSSELLVNKLALNGLFCVE